jgi:hypothetical protein
VAGIALLIVALVAAPAAAETTLGSKLEDSYETTYGGTAGITVYQEAAPSEVLSAPSGGTIKSWSVRSADHNAKYELRVIRPAGGEFTAVATSSPQTVPDSEDKVRGPFATNLAVKTGDRIGLYVVEGAGAPINNTVAPIADEMNYVQDPFADGSTKLPALASSGGGSQELLLQATLMPAPPVNTALPTITGEARAGTLLTVNEGEWENATSYAFQWVRCAGATCSFISGATSTTYTPTTADEGKQLKVEVTATGDGGKATASSELTDGVKPAPAAAPSSTGPPVLSGEARETETLSGTNGNWTGSPTRFEYQWLRCSSVAGTGCSSVGGATSSSYKLVHADAGSTMRLQVTASNTVGPTTAESAPSAIVQPLTIRAQLAITPSPTCTGIPTYLDGSGSQTPNMPITRYHYTYVEFPLFYQSLVEEEQAGGSGKYLSSLPVQLLSDGPAPVQKVVFTWNRKWSHELDIGFESVMSENYVRDPVLVTLEVTDLAGATAKASKLLDFSSLDTQYSGENNESFQGRTGCPKPARVGKQARLKILPSKTIFSKKSVSTKIRCVTRAPCTGAISVFPARSSVSARNSKAGGKQGSTPIASMPFFSVAANHSSTIRSRLTKAGRAFFRRRTTARVTLELTSVSPMGKATTHSARVTAQRK